MAISVASEQRIELLGTVELLHDHLTTSLCQTVFQQTRTTERERQWSLEALVSFWTGSHFACSAVPDPGLARSSTRQRLGVAPCAYEPRSVFPTLPELELAFLCQPV